MRKPLITAALLAASFASASAQAPAAGPTGSATLSESARITVTLAATRANVAAHPADPAPHIAYSAALLDAGIATQALTEARTALTLAPDSVPALLQLARALQSNTFGIPFGIGFDHTAALEAVHKALQLDPNSTAAITALAQLNEYNNQGEHYGPGTNLPEAIRLYRSLKPLDPAAFNAAQDALLADLVYTSQFTPALAQLNALGETPARDTLILTATAGSLSAHEAILRADRITDPHAHSVALHDAAVQLAALGLYPKAAELFDAGIEGPQDAAEIRPLVDTFRYLQHLKAAPTPPDAASTPVVAMLNALIAGDWSTQAPTLLDRHAYATDDDWHQALTHAADANLYLLTLSRRFKLPTPAMRDILATNSFTRAEGDDLHGYRIYFQSPGTAPRVFFVSKDDAAYKIVADNTEAAPVAAYATYLLQSKREPEARALLDWKRAVSRTAGSDDPLGGDLFSHAWPGTQTATPPPIPPALVALQIQSPTARPSLEPLTTALAASPDDSNLNLLLAVAYLNRADPTHAKPSLDKLLAKFPDTLTPTVLMGDYYALTHDTASWQSFLAARLAKHPADPELLRQSALASESAGDYAAARKSLQQIIDANKANPGDYNNIAWLTLFDNTVNPKALEQAQKAVTDTHHLLFGTLHTLACLTAAQGDPAAARPLLFEAMTADLLTQPNSAVWFALGLIEQQFGDPAAAIAAYQQVKPTPGSIPDPTDTAILAQQRLATLHPK